MALPVCLLTSLLAVVVAQGDSQHQPQTKLGAQVAAPVASAPKPSVKNSTSENISDVVATAKSAEEQALKHAEKAIDTLVGFDVTVNGAAQDASCVKASVASLATDAFWGNFTGNRAKALKECFETARKADKKKFTELKDEAKQSCETLKKAGHVFVNALKHNGTANGTATRTLEQIQRNVTRTSEELQRRAEHAAREVERRVEDFYREAENRSEAAEHKLDELDKAKKKLEKEASEAAKKAQKTAEDMKRDAEKFAETIGEQFGAKPSSNETDHKKDGEKAEQGEQLAADAANARSLHLTFFALAAVMSGVTMTSIVVKRRMAEPVKQSVPAMGRSPFEYPASSSGKACMISRDGMEVRV